MKGGVVLAALVLPAAAAAATDPHPATLVGRYDGGRMEMAAGLELSADGSYRYGLSYGALDEQSAGTWTATADGVRLTTVPPVVPPRFVLVEDRPAARRRIVVRLADPRILNGGRLTVLLFREGRAEPEPVDAGGDGVLAIAPGAPPVAVLPILPMFQLGGAPTPLSPDRGHDLLFRFEPNDIGRADLSATPLRREGTVLLLTRFGETIRFRKP